MSGLGRWWGTEVSGRTAYLVAATLGLAALLAICGPSFVLGTSSYWDMPSQDHRAYMLGYRYFLDEPWHWPLLTTHTMSVPFAKSIAFTDSIPIWALLHKAIGTVIPPWETFTERSYLGLWYVLVYTLQSCMAVAILRELGHRTWAATLSTSLIVLALPSWLFRFNHASLDAHWLLLWAILMYVRTPALAPASRRLRATQIAHLALCSLINPYHSVASLGIFVASLLRSRQWRSMAWWLALAFMAIGVSLWLAGYFEHDAKLKMWGFDAASANLLTFFLPRYSGLFGESLWRDGSGYQYEGLGYLGVGVFILVAASARQFPSLLDIIKRHRYLFLVALAFFLFALSNHIFLGTHSILSFKYPKVVRWVTYQFRCPGRFVWLSMYLIVIVALHWSLTGPRRGWTQLVIPAAIVLQLVEARPQVASKHNEMGGAAASYLPREAWHSFIARHSFVYVMPTHDCILAGPPGIQMLSTELQYFASERTLPINGVYSARPTRDCEADPKQWPTVPAPGGVYVFMEWGLSRYRAFMAAGAACAVIPFGRVCSVNRGAIEALITSGGAKSLTPPRVAIGQGLVFERGANETYLESGWSYPDESGRWTDELPGTVWLELSGEVPARPEIALAVSSVICGARRNNDVDVLINGAKIGTLHFDETDNDASHERVLPILDRELLRGPMTIELRPRDSRPLNKVDCNGDPRALGVMLRSLTFR